MGGNHARRIRNLLEKGTLTGFEIAKIFMSQMYEIEKIAEPELYDMETMVTWERYKEASVLTAEELDTLKVRSLKGHIDRIEGYNNWLGAFPSFLSLIFCAHIHYLQIRSLLYSPMVLLERYLRELIIKLDSMQAPDILTEKQFHDLRSAQRKEILEGECDLGWLLYWRAERISQKDFGEGCMETLLEHYPGRAIDAYHQACSDFRSLLEKGKLTLNNQKNVIALLEDMLNRKSEKEILALIDSTLSSQAKIRPDKPEPLLEQKVKVKDLYESGLPGWVEHVEEYKHNYGKSAPYDFAIIQNPTPEMIDRKGHYKKRASSSVSKTSNQNLKTVFAGHLLRAKYYILLFLFRRSLLKAVSETTGIDFCSQADKWYEEIKCTLCNYEEMLNNALLIGERTKKSLDGIPRIINLEELQISPMLEEKFRERLSKPLEMDKWVSECHMYFLDEIKEKVKNGVFEQPISASAES